MAHFFKDRVLRLLSFLGRIVAVDMNILLNLNVQLQMILTKIENKLLNNNRDK